MKVQKKTLQRFFSAFKPGEALLPKEIIERTRLPRNTIFHLLKYGVAKGFVAKVGRRYHLRFPEKLETKKHVELPPSWLPIYNLKLEQVAEKNKVDVEMLPEWVKELVKAWVLHDAYLTKKFGWKTPGVMLTPSLRSKLEERKHIVEKEPHTLTTAPLDSESMKWKESFDKWVLKQLKMKRKTTF